MFEIKLVIHDEALREKAGLNALQKEKYKLIITLVSQDHSINAKYVEVIGLVVGSRGTYNKGLPSRLSEYNLGKRAAHNMALTAAEQSNRSYSEQFSRFSNPALLSELVAAQRAINPDYNINKSPEINNRDKLTKEWKSAVTQAVGVDILLANSPPSTLISFRYPRIVGDDGAYLQPDVIIRNRSSNDVYVIDFAVTYETTPQSIKQPYEDKVGKYLAIVQPISKIYKIAPDKVAILPLITGSRGGIDTRLSNNLQKLRLSRSTAVKMAETSAEQTIAVFNSFTDKHYNWRPSKYRRIVHF
ncbi:hypothetical protein GJ496_009786 [Pomphorhynchus laevis]|nr:hypothetical protein GJ496_009786 [Pomphorhynchus laevis]